MGEKVASTDVGWERGMDAPASPTVPQLVSQIERGSEVLPPGGPCPPPPPVPLGQAGTCVASEGEGPGVPPPATGEGSRGGGVLGVPAGGARGPGALPTSTGAE